MTNYNYNGMNAQSIADKIIKREEEYLATELDALSFEEKCRLALRHNNAFHPLSCRLDITELTGSIYPELLRRADADDGFALYCLAALFTPNAPRKDTRLEYLERASERGSLEARIHEASRNAKNNTAGIYPLIEEIGSLINKGVCVEWNEHLLYLCHNMLASYETDEALKESAKRASDELAMRFVLNGSYYHLCHLCVKNRIERSTLEESKLFDDETLFWKTVAFMVDSYFYERGARHLADHLGIRMINAIGCERDLERAKSIYVDLLFSRAYDRAELLRVAKVSQEESLCEAERTCRAQIKDGKIANYWRLILIYLLSEDRGGASAVCDEIISTGLDAAISNIPKAYHMLLKAPRK